MCYRQEPSDRAARDQGSSRVDRSSADRTKDPQVYGTGTCSQQIGLDKCSDLILLQVWGFPSIKISGSLDCLTILTKSLQYTPS